MHDKNPIKVGIGAQGIIDALSQYSGYVPTEIADAIRGLEGLQNIPRPASDTPLIEQVSLARLAVINAHEHLNSVMDILINFKTAVEEIADFNTKAGDAEPPADGVRIGAEPCEKCNGALEHEGYGGNMIPCYFCSRTGKKLHFEFKPAADEAGEQDELKPCPFCGAEAEGVDVITDGTCHIQCSNHLCVLGWGTRITSPTMETAVQRWNTRTTNPEAGEPETPAPSGPEAAQPEREVGWTCPNCNGAHSPATKTCPISNETWGERLRKANAGN